MKRIAIELCGLSRTYRDTAYSLLSNVIIPNEEDGWCVDVFIHTWAESDTSAVVWHNPKGENRSRKLDSADAADIIARYRPKAMLIEEPLSIPKEPVLQEQLKPFTRSYSSVVSCFHSRARVNQLREEYSARTGEHYDYVLMTRLDILFLKPFRINDFLKTFGQFGLTVPRNTVFTVTAPFKRGLTETERLRCNTDLILFSDEKTMSRICRFYDELLAGTLTPEYVVKNLYGMEVLWTRYWKDQKIDTALLSFFEGPDYVIVRPRQAENRQGAAPAPQTGRAYHLRRNFQSLCDYFRPLFNWLVDPFAALLYGLKAACIALRTLILQRLS